MSGHVETSEKLIAVQGQLFDALAENQRLREKGQAVADAFAAWSEDWNDGSYAYYKSDDLMVACVKLREVLAGDTE